MKDATRSEVWAYFAGHALNRAMDGTANVLMDDGTLSAGAKRRVELAAIFADEMTDQWMARFADDAEAKGKKKKIAPESRL